MNVAHRPADLTRCAASAIVCAVLALALAGAAAPAEAAPAAPAASGISGLWQLVPGQGGGGSRSPPEQRVARDVNGALPAMKPWVKKLVDERVAAYKQGKYFANTASLCLPQGTPYMLHGAITGPIQVLETPGQVTIISEEMQEIWMMYLDQQHPPEPIEPTFHGDTVARWEGNTLVADSVAISERTTLDQIGTPHSDALRVITRIQVLPDGQLEFRYTIDDPKAFDRPWDRRVLFRRAPPGERVKDTACENQTTSADADGYQVFKLE